MPADSSPRICVELMWVMPFHEIKMLGPKFRHLFTISGPFCWFALLGHFRVVRSLRTSESPTQAFPQIVVSVPAA